MSVKLNETLTVPGHVDTVFRYISDFRNIEEWDPGVVSSVKLSDGPIGEGTEYELVLRYGPVCLTMNYMVTEYVPLQRVVLKGEGETFSVTDTIRFEQNGNSTRIDYIAGFEFTGLSDRKRLLITPLLSRIGKQAIKGMRHALTSRVRVPDNPEKNPGGRRLVDYIADRTIIPGMLGFSSLGYWISRPFWKPGPRFLTGKTVLITGATSGVGKAAATAIAGLDANLIFLARDPEKAEVVKAEIIRKTGNPHVDFYIADLSRMSDIRSAVQELNSKLPVLDVLINNAGALYNHRDETEEGLEKTFALNLLGVYYLTEKLSDLFSKSRGARIINISSGGMYTQKIRPDDLQYKENPYDGDAAYARTKRGMVILSQYWADSLASKGVRVHAMHPGWVDTPGLALSLPRFRSLMKPVLRTPEQGADTVVWLASAAEPGLCSGMFWLDRRPHITHVFSGTRETQAERALLIRKLKEYTEAAG